VTGVLTLRRGISSALTILALLGASPHAFGKCEVRIFGQLPLTMRGFRPLVPVKFNGQDAFLIADSGAFFSMMSDATAQEFGLKTGPLPRELRVTGVGGDSANVSLTTVKDFTLGGQLMHRVDFLVGGTEMDYGTAGILGQNVLGGADTEYDLANGFIRLIKTNDCRKETLAYWAKDEAVEMVEIEPDSEARMHTIGTASVNGVKIKVMFDSGAGISLLTLRAAQRAGIKLDSPGVVAAGQSYGLGKSKFNTWIAPVASFALGGEEIKNTKLRIAEMPNFIEADMLLGPDFFLSHRIYVSNQQHKLYFTYNGGPVFNLKTVAPRPEAHAVADSTADPAAQSTPVTAGDAPAASGAANPAGNDDAPTSAAEQSRLGMALASRHDYEHALEDLNRACALAPSEPEYFYQRASIQMDRRQVDAALSDLDTTLRLKPDHLPALLARAQTRLSRGEAEPARADLDAAARSAPKPSEYRYELAMLYARAHLLPEAIAQYDLWIAAHPEDANLGAARNARCQEKVLLDRDLENALSDCNAAVRSNPKSAAYLGNRGTARLRRGDYKKAIDDFDAALNINPKLAWSLYGRGIAEIRLGNSVAGQADIAAAKAIRATIAEDTAAYGLLP